MRGQDGRGVFPGMQHREMWVWGPPKYPQEAAGMVLPCDPMQRGSRPGHVGLN